MHAHLDHDDLATLAGRSAVRDRYTTITARHLPPPNSGAGLKLTAEGKIILDVAPNGAVDDDSDDDVGKVSSVVANHTVAPCDVGALQGTWAPMTFKMPRVPIPEELDRKFCPPSLSNATSCGFLKEKFIVVYGGSTDSVPTNDTWMYNLETRFWTQLSLDAACPSPPARSGQCACALRDIEVPLWKKDRERMEECVRLKQPIPGDIQRTLYNPQMWIFGGADILQRTYYNDMWVFELASKKWRKINAGGVKPSPRWQASCASVELRVYVFGGESPDYSLLGDLHVYDHHQEVWSLVRSPSLSPPPRTMHAACMVRDTMVLCGGIGTTTLTDTWLLETRSLNWTRLVSESLESPFVTPDKKLSGVHGHAMVACNEYVFLHGGKVHNKFNAQAWVLDTKTSSWYKSDPEKAPIARWRHCLCALREINATKTMDLFLSLDEMQEQGIHLTDEKEMKGFITGLRSGVVQQRLFQGMQSSFYEKPYVSNTVGIVIFGGVGFARMFCDLWKYALPNVQTNPAESTMLSFDDIENGSKEEDTAKKKKGRRRLV